MTKPIIQSVRFPTTARKLYELYLDPKRHAAFTGGGKVTISPKPGSFFSAFDEMLTGITLFTIPSQLIVQRWRSMNFKETDLDSILILQFTQTGKQARIDLTHVNVPAQDHAGVTHGWKKYYWTPLRRYLKATR
jgi:activator of HSP90 ATPase